MKMENKIKGKISAVLLSVAAVFTVGGLFSVAASAATSFKNNNPATSPKELTAADFQGLSTKLENGTFEIPDIGNNTSPWYMMAPIESEETDNGTTYHITPSTYRWKTTAYDQIFELGGDYEGITNTAWDYNLQYHNNVNVMNPYPNNKSVAELVAEEQGSLYQNISTTPGARLSWGLTHIARQNAGIIGKGHYKDIMALFIGKTPSHELKKQNPRYVQGETKDIFMWMGELVKQQAEGERFDFGSGSAGDIIHEKKAYTIYASPNAAADILSIDNNNYQDYFSMQKTSVCTEEWKCWIIADTGEAWGVHGGKYDVPDGQTTTTFAFTALTGTNSTNDAKLGLNEGNLLDNIKFAIAYPLVVSSTGGGSGTVTASMDADGELIGKDENGDPTNTDTVNDVKSHKRDYMEGTKVTVTATPEDGFTFLGVFVDGGFTSANTENFFTVDDTTNTYKFSVEMNKARYIQLIFVGHGKVLYDPHGGKYNGKKGNTIVEFNKDGEKNGAHETDSDGNIRIKDNYHTWYNPVGNAVPPIEDEEKNGVPKERFVGWYFARGTQVDDDAAKGKGALITSSHTVEYSVVNPQNPEQDVLKLTYKSTSDDKDHVVRMFSAQEGITFVAEYDYLQRGVAMTDSGSGYVNNSTGGTVEVTLADSDGVTDVNNDRNLISGDSTIDQYGYARLRDRITMTAAVNEGYTFVGWYEKAADGSYNLKQKGETLNYGVDTCHTYYALFAKTGIGNNKTFVSFVSESTELPATAANTPFADGSHVKSYENGTLFHTYMSDKNRTGGETVFGNTISTGFTVRMQKNAGDSSNTINWTITIPLEGAAGKTYVKFRNSTNAENNKLFKRGNSVLADSETLKNSYFNSGEIYEVTEASDTLTGNYGQESIGTISMDDALWDYYGLGSIVTDSDASSDEIDSITDDTAMGEAEGNNAEGDESVADFINPEEKIPDSFYEDLGEFENPFEAEMNNVTYNNNIITIKLRRNLGTTISGATEILYGLVIDNLYAPAATATAEMSDYVETSDFQDVDNEDMTEKVNASTALEYKEDDNNKYYKYEKGWNE